MSKKQRISVEVTDEFKKEIKIYCALKGIMERDLVLSALNNEMKKGKKENK